MIHHDKAIVRKIELLPYERADRVHFGFTQTAVEKLEGPPDVVDTNYLGERNEYRDSWRITYDSTRNTVVEFGFAPSSALDVVFDGASMLCDECDPLRELMKRDSEPSLLFGFLVFHAVGMTLTGYHDGASDQRAICLFERGRFDRFIGEMKPFRL